MLLGARRKQALLALDIRFFFQIALRGRGNSTPVGGESEILLGGFFY